MLPYHTHGHHDRPEYCGLVNADRLPNAHLDVGIFGLHRMGDRVIHPGSMLEMSQVGLDIFVIVLGAHV